MWTYLVPLALLAISAASGQTEEEVVRSRLFENYNKHAKPSGRPRVILGLNLIHYDMNEELNTMDLDFWLHLDWKDSRLEWNSVSTGIDVLNHDPSTVWIPDITLYNNADPSNFDTYSRTRVVSKPDGSMLWIPPGHGKAYCYMDMTHWPHDVHNCTFKFGSWVHSDKAMEIKVKDDVEIETMATYKDGQQMGQWILVSHSMTRIAKTYDCCPEEYATMEVNFVVERNAPGFDAMVQGPVVALCLLTVVIFMLPPASGEKIFLGAIALLLNFFFLLSVSKLIGHSAAQVPLIVQLISKQLYITTASVFLSAWISRMVRVPKGRAVPEFLEKTAMTLAPCFLLKGYKDMVTSSKPAHLSTNQEENVELKEGGESKGTIGDERGSRQNAVWMLLGALIDRVCFVVFLVLFIVLMSCYAKVL